MKKQILLYKKEMFSEDILKIIAEQTDFLAIEVKNFTDYKIMPIAPVDDVRLSVMAEAALDYISNKNDLYAQQYIFNRIMVAKKGKK